VRRLIRKLALAMALTALAGPAGAHAFLDHASPKVGSTLSAAPSSLQLWFTQGLVAAFCRVSIEGPAGFGGAGSALPAPGDGRSLVVALKGPTPPGVYRVRWRVLSVDTHTTEGDFTFKVAPKVAPGGAP
jgi:methionine-rich copper-binding protein CopC